MVANNTEIVRDFSQGDKGITNLKDARIGDSIDVEGHSLPNSDLVMVINPFIESEFFIEKVNYTANLTGVNGFNLVRDLKMVIREPRGVGFMHELEKIYQNVNARSTGAKFVLKTVFIGHNEDGSTDMLPDTNPLLLTMQDFKASFDAKGGVYNLVFFGSQNGWAGQHPQLGVLKKNRNLVADDRKLSTMMKDLETKMNEQLHKEWETPDGTTVVNKIPLAFNRKKVQFHITIPPAWADYDLQSVQTEEETEIRWQDGDPIPKEKETNESTTETKPTGKIYLNTGEKVPVLKVIESILKHCKQIREDVIKNSEGGQGGMFKVHKVVTALTSDNNQATIHVDVIEHYVAIPPQNDVAADEQKIDKPANGIEFDYIFSGKNTDILKFDMQIDDAIVFMNAGLYGNKPMDQELDVIEATKPIEDVKVNRDDTMDVCDVCSHAGLMNDIQTPSEEHADFDSSMDSTNSETTDRQKYLTAIGKLLSRTMLSAKLQIRGNPGLYNQFFEPIMPHSNVEHEAMLAEQHSKAETISNKLAGDTGLTFKDFDVKTVQLGGDMSNYVPLFVKVNVFTPSTEDSHSDSYAEQFWWRYWYRVLVVQHSFDNGAFTQTLELNAHIFGSKERTI